MSVVHVHIPAFGIEVERVVCPKLKEVPLAITATTSPRAQLIWVSPEASKAGIKTGDRLSEALKYEPRLRVLPNNPALYQRAQNRLLTVVQKFTPLYEPFHLGSFYLDMKGTEGLFGKIAEASCKILKEIQRELRLAPSIGIGENKLISRVAGKVVRPKEICDVFSGNEAVFLAPLDVRFLPGLGEKTQETLLRELGVRKIRDLAAIPTPILMQVFGKRGQALKEFALGIDHSAVNPPQSQREVKESFLLKQETNNEEILLSHLWEITERLGRILRDHRCVPGACLLEGLYSDRRIATHRFSIHPPTNLDFSLFVLLESHWRRFITRRIAVKSFSVTFSVLLPEVRQMDFYDQDEKEFHLVQTLDRLRGKYGPQILKSGRALCGLPISTVTPITR